MIATTLAAVAGAVDGVLHGPDAAVTGPVEIDSRLVRAGGLFVALPGERTDGHDHVLAATQQGAVGALTARPVDGACCVVVGDVLLAMQQLARVVFDTPPRPLTFAITGSSGKTTTKDLLAHVLGAGTLSPVGSFNNEIGMPLTCLRRAPDTSYAVLEYSARGRGHIAFLSSIVRPDVSIVLNVGSAHLGEFGSSAAIAVAKGELVEALVPGGRAVLGPGPLTAQMAPRAPEGVTVQIVPTPAGLTVDTGGRASFDVGDERVHLRLVGEHQAANAMAVLVAASDAYGGPVPHATVLARLRTAEPASAWRMAVTERSDGITIVNDAYNANPEAMRAALKTLAVMSDGKKRRTVAVLGVMGELGEDTRELHMDLGRFVVRLDIGQLVVVGADAGGIHAGAVLEGSWGSESIHVPDVGAALDLLRAELRPGDVVLVKGSRSAGLERVAAGLLPDHQSAQPNGQDPA